MRPATAAETCRRFQNGQPRDKAVGDVPQGVQAADASSRAAMPAEEPPRRADMPRR